MWTTSSLNVQHRKETENPKHHIVAFQSWINCNQARLQPLVQGTKIQLPPGVSSAWPRRIHPKR